MVRVKIPIVVAAICVLLFAATRPVKAEWISVAPFKGVVTDVYPAAPTFAFARKSTGWTISPTGELRRLSWNRMALSNGLLNKVTFIGPHPDPNAPALTVLFGSDPYKYDVANDAFTLYAGPISSDTVNYWAADSVYHRSNGPADSTSGSRWLELVLLDIGGIVIGGVSTGISGFYNDWLIRAPDVIGSSGTTTLGDVPLSISTTQPPGMFLANETLFVADGGSKFKYITNDTAQVFYYPAYTDTGTTATIYKRGDSLVIRVDSTLGMSFPASDYFLLLSVDDNPNGIPFIVHSRSDSSTWARLFISADSAYYYSAFCMDTITRYLLFRPRAGTTNYLGEVTGDFDYLGKVGVNYYGVFRPRVPRGASFGEVSGSAMGALTTIEGRQCGELSAYTHPAANGIGDSMYVYLDFTNASGGDSSAVRCAIYGAKPRTVSGPRHLVDTTNIRWFLGTSADGWYGFKLQNAPTLYAESTYALQVMGSTMTTDDVGTRAYYLNYSSFTAWSSVTTWGSPLTFTGSSNYGVFIGVVMTQTGSIPEIPGVVNQRSFDRRMMRFGLSSYGQFDIPNYSGQAKIIKDGFTGDTLMLFLWSNSASRTPADGSYLTLRIAENSRFTPPAAPSAGANTNYNMISCLHRFRAFYAGGQLAYRLSWSADNDYDNIVGSEDLEGDDPIRALASDGGDLFIGRRHKLQGVQGSSISDFYFIPSPAGVGCVSQYSVVKNPIDNCLYFINELGLWRHCAGGGADLINSQFASLFADSVYWLNETQFQAVIFDDKYWVTMQFKAPIYDWHTTGSMIGGWRLLTFDLTDGSAPQMTFLGKPYVNALYVTRFTQGGQFGGADRLYMGDADSSILYRLNESYTYPDDPYGGSDQVYELSDYRSCWIEGSGRDVQKRVLAYEMAYTTHGTGDTVIVDFYTDYSETAKWSDTVTATTSGRSTWLHSVSREIQGESVAFGIRASDSADVVHGMSLNIVETGKRRKD